MKKKSRFLFLHIPTDQFKSNENKLSILKSHAQFFFANCENERKKK